MYLNFQICDGKVILVALSSSYLHFFSQKQKITPRNVVKYIRDTIAQNVCSV